MELPSKTIIASGPVIIENGKVLLNREKKSDGEEKKLFMFPGGQVEDFNIPLEETSKRESKEEMGIEIRIIKPLRTLINKNTSDETKIVILTHYLAERIGEIKPGEEILEWDWFDINNLPENCTPNVYEILKDIKKEL